MACKSRHAVPNRSLLCVSSDIKNPSVCNGPGVCEDANRWMEMPISDFSSAKFQLSSIPGSKGGKRPKCSVTYKLSPLPNKRDSSQDSHALFRQLLIFVSLMTWSCQQVRSQEPGIADLNGVVDILELDANRLKAWRERRVEAQALENVADNFKALDVPFVRDRGAAIQLIPNVPNQRFASLAATFSRGIIQLRLVVRASDLEPEIRAFEQLHSAAVDRAAEFIKNIAAEQILDETQCEKLVLAASGDACRAFRPARSWLDEFGNQPINDAGMLRTAVAQISELNAQILESIYGSSSLFTRVFNTIVSPEQQQRIAESHLSWFVTPEGLRYKMLDPAKKQALLSLLIQNSDRAAVSQGRTTYCLQVLRSIPSAELARVLSADDRELLEKTVQFYERTTILAEPVP